MRTATSLPLRPVNELDHPSAAEALRADMAAGRVPDGAIIRYTRTFSGVQTYTYAAVHIGGDWYTTSKTRNASGVLTHEDFMETLRDEHTVTVEVASDFTAVSAPDPTVNHWA